MPSVGTNAFQEIDTFSLMRPITKRNWLVQSAGELLEIIPRALMGMHGAPYTNRVLDECDLLVGLGVRFDDRATGKVAAFCPQADIIHVDIDDNDNEIDNIISTSLSIQADVGEVLMTANKLLHSTAQPVWRSRIELLKQNHPLVLEGKEDLFRPYGAIKAEAALLDDSVSITTDVGQHQM